MKRQTKQSTPSLAMDMTRRDLVLLLAHAAAKKCSPSEMLHEVFQHFRATAKHPSPKQLARALVDAKDRSTAKALVEAMASAMASTRRGRR